MNASSLPILVLGALVITACGRGSRDASRADTIVSAAAAAPALPLFELVGQHAENAYDQVKLADWSAARASADSLRAIVGRAEVGDTAGHGAELVASLQNLDSAVASRSRTQGMRVANHLTELGSLLATGRAVLVPAEVTLLDFYGRELEIWSAARDTAQLLQTASSIKRTWDEVRPVVVARGGTAEAVRFDSIVVNVTASRTPAQYGRTATPLLDQVDALELVFTQ